MTPEQFIEHVFSTMTDGDLAAYSPEHRRYGHVQNYPRVEAVARYCAEHWPGDLLEIGCMYGDATVLFAAIAREHNRRVIAVDSWSKHPQYAENFYYQFCARIAPYEDIVDIVKLCSQTKEAVAYIKNRPLCFVYVDGSHLYKDALSDIKTVSHCAGIIAVDDILQYESLPSANEETRRAFNEGAVALGRTPLSHYLCREGYLPPGGDR